MRKRRSQVTENEFLFPEEILYEILSWLGVKSLLRCKSVCKVWYVVIENKQFVDMHAIRNGHRFYDIGDTGSISINSAGIKEKIRHLCFSCGGFLLVERSSLASVEPSSIYQISNPTTKRILDLPHPHKRVMYMQVFLNSSTSSYNVVSVYFDKENKKVQLELIDLGGQSNDPCPNADLSWKTLDISEFDKVSRQQRYHFKYCMSSEGVFYILALLTVESSNPKIICVDLAKQACTTLNVPQGLLVQWHAVNFQLWRGKPIVLFKLEEKLNIWMLEDYKKQKWADTIVILLPFLKQNPIMKNVIPYLDRVGEEDVLVYRKGSQSYCVFKLVSKELCTVPSSPSRVPATLVSVKGMQPEKIER